MKTAKHYNCKKAYKYIVGKNKTNVYYIYGHMSNF